MGVQTFAWTDKVRTIAEEDPKRTEVDRTISELDDLLKNKAESRKLVRLDAIYDLTTLGALSIPVLTTPANCEIKYVAAIITELVVAGGTTVKLGIGPTGTKNKYGNLAALTAGTKVSGVYGTLLTSAEAIILSGVATGGTAAGDTNISAGKVRIVIEYYVPNDLS